jgi:predicted amidohydrolase
MSVLIKNGRVVGPAEDSIADVYIEGEKSVAIGRNLPYQADEVFDASLDANGCEEFLKLIHSLEDANVFVISHKGDIMQDKFRSTIRFEKHKNFSRIAA